MDEPGTIRIELIEVLGAEVKRRPLELPAGTRIATLLVMLRGPLGTAGQGHVLARFGKVCDDARIIEDGDSLQWLGPLQVDPKVARFRRVARRRAQALRNKWSPGQTGGGHTGR